MSRQDMVANRGCSASISIQAVLSPESCHAAEIKTNVKLASIRAVVRGAGEIGSAIAHGLRSAGAIVAVHDRPVLTASRRGMAFVDAMHDDVCTLEGMTAHRVEQSAQLERILEAPTSIPLTSISILDLLDYLRPNVLVDARVSRGRRPAPFIHMAPHTIGVGPNLIAGIDAHAVIESAWGEQMGTIILQGSALPHGADPPVIDGYGRERFIYAPAAGYFYSDLHIGDHVHMGDQVARIRDVLLLAPLTGYLRGLTRSDVPVCENERVVEIIPEGSAAQIFGLGERPLAIAQGVLRALEILVN